jgi:hypothetical protein
MPTEMDAEARKVSAHEITEAGGAGEAERGREGRGRRNILRGVLALGVAAATTVFILKRQQ